MFGVGGYHNDNYGRCRNSAASKGATMTRDKLMRLRLLAIEALGEPSEAVRQAAKSVLLVLAKPKEFPHEKRLRRE